MNESESNKPEQDKEAAQSLTESYDAFIEEVLDTEVIWGLSNEEGWATCDSNDFDNRQVISFWSNKKSAEVLCVDEWGSYQATPIEFDDFIDAWLHGMHEDEVLAGINWNEDLVGVEIEPVILIEDLIGDED